MNNAKKIVYFVTEDWYFCSHRMDLAIAAKDSGFSVFVVTRVVNHGEEIVSAGLQLVPIKLSRRSKNPFVEIGVIRELTKIYKKLNPDIVHNVAIKPVVYGSIAARVAGVPKIVNAIAGLGFLFSSKTLMARSLRPMIRLVFRLLFNRTNTTVILQNPDDLNLLCSEASVNRSRVRLIRGSGVDTEVYQYSLEPPGPPIVLLASRLLWDKGVGYFVEAARLIKPHYPGVRFVLAGDIDEENPASIDSAQLEEWARAGDVECWGKRADMPSVLSRSSIVCLPTTYGEGVPKVLIEAASCARPIIATDVPGCREIVVHRQNGILVPPGNLDVLVSAIRELLDDPEQRKAMGKAGREIVKEHFSLESVVKETLQIYADSEA